MKLEIRQQVLDYLKPKLFCFPWLEKLKKLKDDKKKILCFR